MYNQNSCFLKIRPFINIDGKDQRGSERLMMQERGGKSLKVFGRRWIQGVGISLYVRVIIEAGVAGREKR